MKTINNRYEILWLEGTGGMGRIYRVTDKTNPDRELALKVLRDDRATERHIQSLKSEYKLLSSLDHPNLETVYSLGQIQSGPEDLHGSYYFTCEFIRGTSLADRVGNVSWRDLITFIIPICRGLHFLHTRDLVHFDVKPDNMLVPDTVTEESTDDVDKEQPDRTTLIDFGLADEKTLKGGIAVKGTLHYIAPEVIRLDPVGPAADLYSLGICLYELLRGSPPFQGSDQNEVLRKHIEEPISSAPPLPDSVPDRLEALIYRLLEKNPNRRPASANEVLQTLSEIGNTTHRTETEHTLKGYTASAEVVGRDKELKWLENYLNSAENQEQGARFALLEGEIGIGKTELLNEIRVKAQLRGITVLRGRASRDQSVDYGLMRKPVIHLIRHLEASRDPNQEKPLIDQYTPHLAKIDDRILEISEHSETREGNISEDLDPFLDRVTNFFLEAAQEEPILLLLDDIHLAGSVCQKFIDILSRKAAVRAANHGLIIIGARTTTENAPGKEDRNQIHSLLSNLEQEGHLQRTILSPLSRQERTQLVRSVFGDSSDELISEITALDWTGNPRAMNELLEVCVENGVIRREGSRWLLNREKLQDVGLPDHLQDITEQRIKQLSPRKKEWLRNLTLWGGRTRRQDLHRFFPEEPNLIRSDIRSLEHDRYLRVNRDDPDVVYEIQNHRIREKLLDSLSQKEKTERYREFFSALHRYVRGVENPEDQFVERLARIAWRLDKRDVFRTYGERAANIARNRGAWEQAVQFTRWLLDCEPERKKQNELHLRLSELYQKLGQADRVKDHLNRIGGSNIAPEIEIRRKNQLFSLYQNSGREEKAVELFQTVRDASKDVDPANESYWEHYLRLMLSYSSIVINHRKNHKKGEQVLRNIQNQIDDYLAGDTAEELHRAVDWNTGYLHMSRGDYSKSIEPFRRALRYHQKIGNRLEVGRIKFNLSTVQKAKGNIQEALRLVHDFLEISRTINYRKGIGKALNNLSNLYWQTGRIKEGLNEVEKSIRAHREMNNRRSEQIAKFNRAKMQLYTGEIDRAIREFQTGIETTAKQEYHGVRLMFHLMLGRARYETNRLTEAEHLFSDLRDESREKNQEKIAENARIYLGKIMLQREKLVKARDLFKDVVETTVERNWVEERLEAENELGRVERFRGKMDLALETHRNLLENFQERCSELKPYRFIQLETALDVLLHPRFYSDKSFRSENSDFLKDLIETYFSESPNTQHLVQRFKEGAVLGMYEYATGNKRSGLIKVRDVIEEAKANRFRTQAETLRRHLEEIKKHVEPSRTEGGAASAGGTDSSVPSAGVVEEQTAFLNETVSTIHTLKDPFPERDHGRELKNSRDQLNRTLQQFLDQNRVPITLLFMEPDQIRQINDYHGYHVGDRILNKILDLLRTNLDQIGEKQSANEELYLGRTGARFDVLLPEVTTERSHEIATRIQSIICSETVNAETEEVPLSVCAGAAATEHSDLSPETLYRAAVGALNRSRTEGDETLIIHRPDQEPEQRNEPETDITHLHVARESAGTHSSQWNVDWQILSPVEKKETVRKALEKTNGNKSKAAELLGVSRQTIYNHLTS